MCDAAVDDAARNDDRHVSVFQQVRPMFAASRQRRTLAYERSDQGKRRPPPGREQAAPAAPRPRVPGSAQLTVDFLDASPPSRRQARSRGVPTRGRIDEQGPTSGVGRDPARGRAPNSHDERTPTPSPSTTALLRNIHSRPPWKTHGQRTKDSSLRASTRAASRLPANRPDVVSPWPRSSGCDTTAFLSRAGRS